MWLLHEVKSAAGMRVAEEIEFAGGHDRLFLLWSSFPVVIDGLNIVGLNITGADRAAAGPWEAIGVASSNANTVGTMNANTVAIKSATTEVTMTILLSSSGTHDKGTSESNLREHFFDF